MFKRLFLVVFVVFFLFLTYGHASAKQKSTNAYSDSRDNPVVSTPLTTAGCPRCPTPKKEPPEDEDDGEEKEEEDHEYEEGEDKSYVRMYYSFGIAGSYFAKKGSIDIKGIIGAFTNIEYRLTKIFSFGFDTYYGWLMGGGNQYLSSFNPGIKIFPMMYKNPKMEPFIYIGGHAFDAIFGDSLEYGRLGMAQGAFGGIGFRYFPEAMPIGFQFLVRASFLFMERPKTGGKSGRELTIPIFGCLGVVY